MNLSARTVLVTLAAAVLGIAVAVGAARVTKPDTVVVPGPVTPGGGGAGQKAEDRAVGMAGCMAAACHGAPATKALSGDRGADCWQSSGSCWAAADPHTAAYSLLTERPQRPVTVTAADIMAKYRPGTKATDDARCLACHTNPALAEKAPTPEVVALREQGVSCEACHGNAGRWLQPHTAWTGDRTKPYQDHGLRRLFDIGERALACAGCHVGAPAEDGLPVRDMNHDMIASGHPRLNFDFAEYQRRLPKHWQEKDRVGTDNEGRPRERRPDEWNELQVWYIGRLAHAERASQLLASRAQRFEKEQAERAANPADPLNPGFARNPWPEFAEFNCAACHHELRPGDEPGAGWRGAPDQGRPPGAPPWQTIWPVTHAAGLAQPARASSEVSNLVRLMEGETGQPLKSRHARASAAEPLARATADRLTALRRAAAKTVPDPAVVAKATAFFPPQGGAPLVPEWDSAEQLFFGLAAREYAKGASGDAVKAKFGPGVPAFRARDWAQVKGAFEALIKP